VGREREHAVRKLLAMVAVGAMAVGLAACGGDDDDSSSSTSPSDTSGETAVDFTPREDGKLLVGTELPAPPFWNGEDYDAIEDGFEVDLAKELGERLGGLEFEAVNYPFVGINAGTECECDIVFSQITKYPEREELWDFTPTYFDSDQGLMVGEGTEVADVAAAKELQFGVQAETTGFAFLEDQLKPTKEIRVYDTTVDMFNALSAGDVDAILFDVPILLGAIEGGQAPEGSEIIAQFATGEKYGAVMAKDSPNSAAVGEIMQEMIDDGTVAELQEQYFGVATEDVAPFWEVE
jgi:polar amino acid transport system substrate-binding protein